MQIITLCGSTKFKREFEEINQKLTLDGNIVLSCGVFGHADGIELSLEQKNALDELHRLKISMSDVIGVIVKANYIGNSTMREIEFASRNGKQIQIYNFE
jgi:hypothetical protein